MPGLGDLSNSTHCAAWNKRFEFKKLVGRLQLWKLESLGLGDLSNSTHCPAWNKRFEFKKLMGRLRLWKLESLGL